MKNYLKKPITRKDAISRGLTRYYTGKPCRKNHIADRDVFNGGCLECMKINRRKYEKTEKYENKMEKYHKSEKGKLTRKKFEQTPKAVSYRRNVRAKSPKKKKSDYKYRQTLKGILTRRAREKKEKNMATKLKWRKTTVKGQKLMMWNTMRSRLAKWTTKKILGKRSEMHKIVGCSQDEFRKHIEKQFKPGMTWKNWGKYTWHIDHIIPLARFDPKNLDDVKKANHYTNLRPLWATENLKKNKY